MEKILSDRYYKCFFTGHRILGREETVKKILCYMEKEIEYLISEYGVDSFICGGAMGFDTLAARTVIKLKKKYDWIKLELYIPCHDHYAKWSAEDKAMWRIIASCADNIKYITDGPYEKDCMRKRNMAMVNDAHYCMAYYLNERSGTGMTVRLAKQNSCDIRNIAEYI